MSWASSVILLSTMIMKTILKDVISCSTLQAKVRAAVAAIIIAVLERMIGTVETWGGISAPDL